jgi:hypothetical protein
MPQLWMQCAAYILSTAAQSKQRLLRDGLQKDPGDFVQVTSNRKAAASSPCGSNTADKYEVVLLALSIAV